MNTATGFGSWSEGHYVPLPTTISTLVIVAKQAGGKDLINRGILFLIDTLGFK
jgi:hypothetical protein